MCPKLKQHSYCVEDCVPNGYLPLSVASICGKYQNEMNFILYCGLRALLRSSLLAVSTHTIVIFVVALLVGSEKLMKVGCCFLIFLV